MPVSAATNVYLHHLCYQQPLPVNPARHAGVKSKPERTGMPFQGQEI